ncbi:MAG: RNA polymerase sigma factor [Ignavibacteria bacterium]|nr:RNA polymerase sigma factor [Ignavibacteria bacterium]
MQSPSTLDRFKVSKEELTKLGFEFNSEALPLIKKLYNTSFWILLNNKFAKKIVIQTFIEAIENCNVTKNSAEWQSWIFRIWIREILDFYSRRENDTQTIFYFIDHAELDSKDVVSITKLNKINLGMSEDELIKLLQKLPSVLRMPTIMKEIHLFHYEKIAELLDVPVGVIASRIYRARKLLFLSLSESFHFEEEKRKWKQKDSTKLIFELRKCAFFVDDELTSEQKSEFIESTKNNDQYENEILIQAEMKKIFKNCSLVDSLIVPIQSKIKRKARQKFN